MKWKTALSSNHEHVHYLRGISEIKCIEKYSFTEIIFLLLLGNLPKKNEAALLEAVLVSSSEHGIAVPSAFVPRTVASVGNPIQASIAAGVLSIGDFHGGAVGDAMKLIESGENPRATVDSFLQNKIRIPGLGHKYYKEKDPRTVALFSKSKKLNIAQKEIEYFRQIEKEYKKATGKKLCINVDGAIATLLVSLGFSSVHGRGIFIIGRVLGILAHVVEETNREKPYRRLEEDEISYDGPKLR